MASLSTEALATPVSTSESRFSMVANRASMAAATDELARIIVFAAGSKDSCASLLARSYPYNPREVCRAVARWSWDDLFDDMPYPGDDEWFVVSDIEMIMSPLTVSDPLYRQIFVSVLCPYRNHVVDQEIMEKWKDRLDDFPGKPTHIALRCLCLDQTISAADRREILRSTLLDQFPRRIQTVRKPPALDKDRVDALTLIFKRMEKF